MSVSADLAVARAAGLRSEFDSKRFPGLFCALQVWAGLKEKAVEEEKERRKELEEKSKSKLERLMARLANKKKPASEAGTPPGAATPEREADGPTLPGAFRDCLPPSVCTQREVRIRRC